MMKPRPHALSGRDFLVDMEINVLSQAKALGYALLLGFVLGLVYDLVRPVRRRSSTWGECILDALFALFSGGAIFIYALAAPSGRLGVWELGFALGGFLLYTYLLSNRIYAVTDRFFVLIISFVRRVKNIIKKFLNMTKMYFQNVQK